MSEIRHTGQDRSFDRFLCLFIYAEISGNFGLVVRVFLIELI